MQGGLVGSICFLAFLLSIGISIEASVVSKDFKKPVVKRSNTYDNDDITRTELHENNIADLGYSRGQLSVEASNSYKTEAQAQAALSGTYGPTESNVLSSTQGQDSNSFSETNQYSSNNDDTYDPSQPSVYSPSYLSSPDVELEGGQVLADNEDDIESRSSAIAIAHSGGGNPNQGKKPSPYPSPSYSSAQAQAFIGGDPYNTGANLYNSGYAPQSAGYPGSGLSNAHAESFAQASSGSWGGSGYNPSSYSSGYGIPGYVPVDASAQAFSGGSGNNGQWAAVADAQSNNGGLNPYNSGYSIPASYSSQASAVADAQSFSGGHNLYSPNYFPPPMPTMLEYPSPEYNSAQVTADAQASIEGARPLLRGNNNYGAEYSQANAFASARAYSRVIPENELVLPHKIPGAENVINCRREGELHNFWSPSYQCMVCVCIRQYGSLRAVCASCAGCVAPVPPPQPTPVPAPIPYPVPDLIIPPTIPPTPESQVSCDPLPTNQPFQNPMNPCQICICRHTFVFGKADEKISCEDNPQCIIPPEIPILPPEIPPSSPIPTPLCEKFPKNILFPHPMDSCKLCMCVAQISSLGVLEQLISCNPNPECGNNLLIPQKVAPLYPIPPPSEVVFIPPSQPSSTEYPMPIPPSPEFPIGPEFQFPLSPDYPIRPVEQLPIQPWKEFPIQPPPEFPIQPLPEYPIQPQQPPTQIVPWPPKGPPGPLPGPPPHKSCNPYPPSKPFQHPWDECQVCMCNEFVSIGIVNIEVNCYTKPECCVIPPYPLSPAPEVTTIAPIKNDLQILDTVCELKSFGVEFVHPGESCRICKCDIYGIYVIPACKRASRPECLDLPAPIPNTQVEFIEPRCRHRLPHQPFVTDCNICVCQAVFNYVVAKCSPIPNCQRPVPRGNALGPVRPSFDIGGYNKVTAEASAQAQTQFYPSQNLFPGGSQSSAVAEAESITSNYPSGWDNPGQSALFQTPSSVDAQALANAFSEFNGQQYNPGYNYKPSGSSSASAEAIASSNALNQYPSQSMSGMIPSQSYIPQDWNSPIAPSQSQSSLPYGGYSGAQAAAQAAATQFDSGSNYYSPYSNSYPYSPNAKWNPYSAGGLSGTQASASAESSASSQSSSVPYYNPSSNSYPYSPNSNPGLNQGTYSGSQAEASASANSNFPSPNYYSPINSYTYSPNSNSYPYSPNSNSYPYTPTVSGQSNAAAEGIAASELYPTLYPVPIPQKTALYYPGQNSWDSSAQASASANGDSFAQSFAKAMANTGGRSVIRSGRGLCKYEGDQYHHNCQACFCLRGDGGDLSTICLGNACS